MTTAQPGDGRPHGPGTAAGTIAAADAWFLAHGLAYFVPEVRQAAREGLRLRRILPLVLLVAVIALGGGSLLAWLSRQVSVAPALLISTAVVAAVWYALTGLRARPIVTWALSRTFGSLRTLLPMMSRALPLLLLFVTFLFINAEVWEMSASLQPGTLWLVALLFGLLAGGFLLVRLPEEVDKVDDAVDEAFVLRACAGTPLEQAARRLADEPGVDLAAYAEVRGYERWNLVVVLVVIQAVQVLLLAASVFAFFLVFGGLVMQTEVQEGWTGLDSIRHLPHLDHLSVPLVQVSVFLSSFSALYLTVSTVTDETYREQFFGSVLRELERAVGMRTVYLALRQREAGGR